MVNDIEGEPVIVGETKFGEDDNRPWKVIGIKTNAVMGQFKTEQEAKNYVKELAHSGANPCKVEYRQ